MNSKRIKTRDRIMTLMHIHMVSKGDLASALVNFSSRGAYGYNKKPPLGENTAGRARPNGLLFVNMLTNDTEWGSLLGGS